MGFLDEIEHSREAGHAVENNVSVGLQRGAHIHYTRPVEDRTAHAQIVEIRFLLPHPVSCALGEFENPDY